MKLWIVLFAAFFTVTAFAANDGAEVAVVYNSAMPESKAVAEHYASMRNVPASQVFGLDLPRVEVISRDQFRDQLQNPLLKLLEKQNLLTFKSSKVTQASIRYIVLCYGVPLTIGGDATLHEKAESKLKPEERKNGAAVDSELATLPSIYQKLPLVGPLSNPVYRTTNSAAINPTNGIIMVARLDGPTAEIARTLVDKAVQAERDGLWGRAYIDMRGLTNGAYAQTDTNFLIAAEVTKRAGYETVVDTNAQTFPASFPMSQIALYAGWYDENVSGPFTRAKVEMMPGAFAYHLHSYNAQTLRSTSSHWAGPLLAKGVAATIGTVDEPFLDGMPDMSIFFTRWLLLHMTYGEAAYSSFMVLSWQGTVIGDPLYNPSRKPAEQRHQELANRGSKLLDWSHLGVININLALGGMPIAELVGYLNAQTVTKTSAILTEKLGDLYQAQGKPESSIHAYRQAIKLDPSPLQEVRLRLALVEKLRAAGKQDEAASELKELRTRFPDYAPQ